MTKRIDLHMHSTFSDGILTPFELVDEAVLRNVEVISITDHDTFDGYSEELFEYARSKGVELIPGIEISTHTGKAGVHVLGYSFDLKNEMFKRRMAEIRESRHVYLREVAERLKEYKGFVVHVEELDEVVSVTKANIAIDIIENDENRELLIEEFGHIPTKGEFIEGLMNKGCPCYVRKKFISPDDAKKLIREAGGKVVLAHPVAYVKEKNLGYDEVEDVIKEMMPDGLEANYIYFDKVRNRFDEIDYWRGVADKYNLKMTMGSDFHGFKSNTHLVGDVNDYAGLSDDEVDEILNFVKGE